MPTLIAGAIAVVLLYSLLQMFRAANPVVLARALKVLGGVVALVVAVFIGLRGEPAIAIPIGIFGAGLLGWSPLGTTGFDFISGIFGGLGAQRSTGRASRVRSQFLDMRLDHDSGELQRADRGRSLCRSLARRIRPAATDGDDLRASMPRACRYLKVIWTAGFPLGVRTRRAMRQGGKSRSAARGKMTDEEAYQILGLQPGAGRDEISRAHRGLMKKLHPDQGGSTYLAARVNEAKETLLRTHRN